MIHLGRYAYIHTYVVTCILMSCITDAAEILEPSEIRMDIVEGQNTTLTCVGVGHPPPLVQWRKLNGSLSDRVSITNVSMSTNEGNVTRVTVDLIFTGAYREDTGVYECSATNLLNIATRSVSLIVQCMSLKEYLDIYLIILLYVTKLEKIRLPHTFNFKSLADQ